MAHSLGSQLFESVGKVRTEARWHDEWKLVGRSLVNLLHARILAFLTLQAHASPNKDRLYVAAACIDEWDALQRSNLTTHVAPERLNRVRPHLWRIAWIL